MSERLEVVATKFQLYTVPGQVYYNSTRKLVLRGVDGLVFVADSQKEKMDDNIESLKNLEENLAEYGYDINDIPLVIQYNKRDLPNVATVNEMQRLSTRATCRILKQYDHRRRRFRYLEGNKQNGFG
jgi:signal recognition particle receptor subunit beta